MIAPDIRTETIFTLLRLPVARAPARDWWTLGALTAIGWIGAVAFLGRYRPNQVATALTGLASPETLFFGALAAAAVASVVLGIAGRHDLAGAAFMVAAFLAGHLAYPRIYALVPARFTVPFRENSHALGFSAARLAYGAALLGPMLVAWWIAFGRRRGWPRLTFRVGDLRVVGRDIQATAAPMAAWRSLLTGYAFFCLILMVIMQANVAFRPVVSGTVWRLMPAILLASAANALVEEAIFRGLIQPAFIRGGGLAAGLWMQGLMFGLMHWGLSVGVLAALPVSLLIGLGSVVWGKIAIDTGGLGWVIAAHAMIDVCVMSAFFVPHG